MLSPTLKRRTLVKGAAWSAPVIAASSAVPVYAASQQRDYTLEYSSHVRYYASNASRTCPTGQGTLQEMTLDSYDFMGTNVSGFAIVAQEDGNTQ